ncbi:MAG TPA: error-prone DNA polymerase [Cellvibrionaceae bacterium]
MYYTHLHTITNFSFLKGASHPPEYINRAAELGYKALAITDECSLAGVVKAFTAAKELKFKLIIGSRFTLSNGMQLIAIAPSRVAYAELSGFITLARRRAPKGEYEAHFADLRFRLRNCLIIWVAQVGCTLAQRESIVSELFDAFKNRLWIGINHQYLGGEKQDFKRWLNLSRQKNIPLVACGEALMHIRERKPLQDVVTAIRHNVPIQQMGTALNSNAEAYLKSIDELCELYPQELLHETNVIADLCNFCMSELCYQYPQELVPKNLRPIDHLKNLVIIGKQARWPYGADAAVEETLHKELTLIEYLHYEYYFLTVHDIVQFARSQNILCQGRGSAANSVVCYCLFVTEIAPGQINVLFERFISKERDEPPDIDIDFEHERREEVIQYIYRKYGRERAALAATVITYRRRSAVRDVGKALGLEPSLINHMAESIAWWDKSADFHQTIKTMGLKINHQLLRYFFTLVEQIRGFPRHLSQHTGGFVICQDRISDIVPLENASMPERTIIQWDKEDLESMHLLKVDILALGMLTALRKTLNYINRYEPSIKSLADIPREDAATYEMLCKGESVGVFQVESRAQMTMLPRLQPRKFYDLVVQIAIVRPGPIQGGMVHPYLRRRNNIEPITYESEAMKTVLEDTLGVPIFQEQVMRLSIVAAGFSGGEADQLRRAMANWSKNSKLLLFEDKFISGLLNNGYELDFAKRMFEQIKGFGGYGFPESHSASFALLCYASSWAKCHHPAAFYCALLNSQPMGFYSPSQLVQAARRQGIIIKPVNINRSFYDNSLEPDEKGIYAIRVGFISVSSLNAERAQSIATARADTPFISIKEVAKRTDLTTSDIEILASADAFRELIGNRFKARWEVSALTPHSELLQKGMIDEDELLMPQPSIEQNVMNDYASIGLTLRTHPMSILRAEFPFNKCKQYSQLVNLTHKSFVRVAGIVTGKQRPGTASGVLFMSLEDETGTSNVVIWTATQQRFRTEILTGKLLVITGTVEILAEKVTTPVVHVIAGNIQDFSKRLDNFSLKSRDFH